MTVHLLDVPVVCLTTENLTTTPEGKHIEGMVKQYDTYAQDKLITRMQWLLTVNTKA